MKSLLSKACLSVAAQLAKERALVRLRKLLCNS